MKYNASQQTQRRATVMTPDELTQTTRRIPESWKRAAGLLKRRKVDTLEYQKQVRQQWEERFQKLERLIRGK